MAEIRGEQREVKLLPGGPAGPGPRAAVPATVPLRQLPELPRDELETLAEEYGLDPTRYRSHQHLVAAIHQQRQIIAELDREAMLDVIRWSRRPVPINATQEQLAMEILRNRAMKFAGLSHRGLVVLARLRGVEARGDEPVPQLVKRLKKQEGWFTRLNRRRRAMLGSLVSKMIGEPEAQSEYRYLPPQPIAGGATPPGTTASAQERPSSIRDEIEEAGLIGGITGRLKKSADAYLNQKLDEIEARIDRKLDEIDRRLGEWRDKEIANRIRILKITLWASVIVAGISLVYSYVKVYVYPDVAGQRVEQRK